MVEGGAAVMRPEAFMNATVAGREPAGLLNVAAGSPVASPSYAGAFPPTRRVHAALVSPGV